MTLRVCPWGWILTLIAAAALGVPARAGAEEAPVQVTYTSGGVVYIDAGEDDGLHPGGIVEVVRAGRVVGALRILFVSARTAAGSLAAGEGAVDVGDQVVFTRHGGSSAIVGPGSGESAPAARQAETAHATRSTRRSRGWFRDRGLNGRIGVGAMSVGGSAPGSRRSLQQTVDARVTGTNIGGTPLSLAVDVRSRRTERIARGELVRDRQARVNLLSGSWRPAGGPIELSAGRQTAAPLGSIGVFDGVQARYTRGRWQVGAITATRPAPVTNAFATDLREHGLYARFESSREAHRRWALGVGALGSYRNGQVDRESVTLQQGYEDPQLSAHFSEEVDVNRGWKRRVGEKVLCLTSFYSYLNRRLSSQSSLIAGFDNRRNARLFQDRDAPEGGFDDTYRDGAWVGANARFLERFDAVTDARWSGLSGSEQNESYTISIGANRLRPCELALHSRTTRFRGAGGEGWLHGLNCDLAPTSRTRLTLRGGTKQDPSVPGGTSLDRYLWYGADFDLGVGRHWFLMVSGERRREAGETIEQVLAKTTWRL